MYRYMDQNPKPFMPLLSAVAANDFNKLIQSRSVAQWKETLAMLVAYVDDSDMWGSLCDALGLRLYQEGDLHAASLCFICSGNVEKAVGVWSSRGGGTLAKMQEVIQKAFVLSSAVPQQSTSHSLCTIVHSYAQVLAAQGNVQMALEYLDMVPGEPSENIQILKDRIYGSGLVTKPEERWGQDDTSYPTQTSAAAVHDYGGMAVNQQHQQQQYMEPSPHSYQESSYPSVYQQPIGGYPPPMGGVYDSHQMHHQSYAPPAPTMPAPSQPPPHQQPFQPAIPHPPHAAQAPPSFFTPSVWPSVLKQMSSYFLFLSGTSTSKHDAGRADVDDEYPSDATSAAAVSTNA